MSQAIPAVARLYEMVELSEMILAYELLAGLTAIQQRGESCSSAVTRITNFFADKIPPLNRDRSPGPDVETILETLRTSPFQALLKTEI